MGIQLTGNARSCKKQGGIENAWISLIRLDYVMETYREGTEIVLYVFHAFLSRMKWERGGEEGVIR